MSLGVASVDRAEKFIFLITFTEGITVYSLLHLQYIAIYGAKTKILFYAVHVEVTKHKNTQDFITLNSIKDVTFNGCT